MQGARVTYVSPSHVLVQIGARTVRADGEANVMNPAAPYFVYSDTIRAWQAPHENEPFSAADKDLALEAIRRHFDDRGTAYIVDPTDEQYRSS